MNGNPISESEGGPEHTRWLSIAAAIASISVVGIAIGLGMPLLSVILETRGHSATMIGLNTAVAGIASIAAAPLATPLAMRFGVVWTMLAMIVIGAFAFLGFYFASSFWMWFPLRAILHVALTVLFILSEFWISMSAPPQPARLRARHLRDRAVARLRLRAVALRADGQRRLPAVRRHLRAGHAGRDPGAGGSRRKARKSMPATEPAGFLRYIWLVPTATAAVLVFGAVETGGFALFPVYGNRIGYSEADAALLLSMIGLGNVILQIPLGMLSDRIGDRRILLLACAMVGLAGMLALPWFSTNWHASWPRCCSSGAAASRRSTRSASRISAPG